MSGLTLQTGLSGSVVDGLYSSGTGAMQPTRTAVPEGPTTVAMAAYGPGAGGSGVSGDSGIHSVVIGGIALVVLICMWWALPR